MSLLGNTINFLSELGLYDVVLPFLLVFTITFAILEKTRILGEEEISGKKYPRKNLDSMVALVTALLIVTTTQLVALINQFLAIVSLVLVISLGFLLMVGIFYEPGQNKKLLSDTWVKVLTLLMFVVLLAILLYMMGILDDVYNWLTMSMNGEIIGSIVIIAIMGAIIAFVVHTPKQNNDTEGGEQ